jgi:hypothetical protein
MSSNPEILSYAYTSRSDYDGGHYMGTCPNNDNEPFSKEQNRKEKHKSAK